MKKVFLEMEKLKHLQTGLGQFCRSLGNEFAKENDPGLDLHYFLPSGCDGIFGKEAKYIHQKAWNKIFIPNSRSFDLWHCLHQDSAYLPPKGVKLLLTIHDLNFLQKYEGTKLQYRLQKLQKRVNRSSGIAVISKYTGDVLREHIQLPDVPLKVIYNGNSLSSFTMAKRPVATGNAPFFFSIGVLSPRKNFHVLPALLNSFPEHRLIIAGPQHSEYSERIREEARKANVEDRVVFVGQIGDEDRFAYYSYCDAFLFPSLSEGFGLPVIEAMSVGKPVFLSALTSLPEIGGEHAFYFENFETEHMVKTIRDGLERSKNDQAFAERVIAHAGQFSWRNAALDYLRFYKEL